MSKITEYPHFSCSRRIQEDGDVMLLAADRYHVSINSCLPPSTRVSEMQDQEKVSDTRIYGKKRRDCQSHCCRGLDKVSLLIDLRLGSLPARRGVDDGRKRGYWLAGWLEEAVRRRIFSSQSRGHVNQPRMLPCLHVRTYAREDPFRGKTDCGQRESAPEATHAAHTPSPP